MKEGSIAVSVSLVFHIILIAFFLRVPFDQYLKPKLILLDFSVEKGQTTGDAEILNRKSGMMNSPLTTDTHDGQRKGRVTDHRDSIVEQTQNTPNSLASDAPTVSQSGPRPVASDTAGQVAVDGSAGRTGMKSDAVTEGVSSGKASRTTAVSSGSGKILNYESDGADERDFLFIRDTIVKRIKDKYPDRARRLGREGRVLLSFDLSSDGVIRNVSIISSSGSRILDDNAKEVVEKTTFNQRIPYARRVHLPVEYRLQ